jgi:hypothetical protein
MDYPAIFQAWYENPHELAQFPRRDLGQEAPKWEAELQICVV